MKKIRDGKKYDTETAELIASWQNSYNPNDFHFESEDLYRTKAGNWFIVGEGGPLTDYAQQCGSGQCGGNQLKIIDGPQVVAWLERTENYSDLEALFPDSVEVA